MTATFRPIEDCRTGGCTTDPTSTRAGRHRLQAVERNPVATSTKTRKSPECTGAGRLNRPEQHARCAGDTELRLPTVPAEWPPVLTYRCGCTCHTNQG